MLNRKNALGFAVLALIYSKLDEGFLQKLSIEPYLNGRESGFAIYNFRTDKKLVFSEYRKSDEVVVYEGRSLDFSMQGNVPSESTYDKAQFFSEVEKAAVHIVNKIS